MYILIQIDDKTSKFNNLKEAQEYLRGFSEPSYTFYKIGGYELLKDGTREIATVESIDEAKEVLDDWGIEYPTKKYYELADFIEDIEPLWESSFKDGGGSGWIEKD